MASSGPDQEDLSALTNPQRLVLERMMATAREADRQKKRDIREARSEKRSENTENAARRIRDPSSKAVRTSTRRRSRTRSRRRSSSDHRPTLTSRRPINPASRRRAENERSLPPRYESDSTESPNRHDNRRRRDTRRSEHREHSSFDPSDDSKHSRNLRSSRNRSKDRHDREDNRFRAEEIEFFNPHLEIKKADFEDIAELGDKIYYRSVHLFIDALKDVDSFKSSELVRRNLNKCLREVSQE